jgi:hypothetical protein
MILNIPGATVRGELYPPEEVDMLTQDMLEVELPGGVFVDVGWFPEHDPGGRYVITAFAGEYENRLGSPVRTSSYEEALFTVLDLAARFLPPVTLVSGSITTTLFPDPVPSDAA